MNWDKVLLRQSEIEDIVNSHKLLVEQLQDAYKRGFEIGYENGYEKGIEEGIEVGYSEAGRGMSR